VIAILVLDSEGERVLAKYYQPPHVSSTLQPPLQSQYITTPQPNPYPTVKDQRTFEKGLFEKTKKDSSDVILYDNRLVVYKQAGDTTLYVIGGAEENEIMLYLVVVAFRDCLDVILKYVNFHFPLAGLLTLLVVLSTNDLS
jgi:coatomer subunit zeta